MQIELYIIVRDIYPVGSASVVKSLPQTPPGHSLGVGLGAAECVMQSAHAAMEFTTQQSLYAPSHLLHSVSRVLSCRIQTLRKFCDGRLPQRSRQCL